MKSPSKSDYKQNFKSLKDVFNFGKHKGESIESVISSDPSYILWAHDEKVAKFTEEILRYAEESDIEQRLDEAMDGELKGMRFWDIYNDD
jgi:hypothetical protein